MENASVDLHQYAANIHSQCGEDGILQKLCELLSIKNGYFCEFGAWDGKFLSNTYKLYLEGWSGCYIEGNPKRYEDLCRNIPDNRITNICAMVSVSGENTLDHILERVHAPKDFDLLSIDIDSYDLAIWRSVSEFMPKCVVIEYNPTIPIGIEYEDNEGQGIGNSSTSLLKLGTEKGYVLIAQTHTNLLFLRRDIFDAQSIQEQTLRAQIHFFFGYDGTLLRYANGKVTRREWYKVPWQTASILQPIPKIIRQWPVQHDILQLLYSVYCTCLTRPWLLIGMARQYYHKITAKKSANSCQK